MKKDALDVQSILPFDANLDYRVRDKLWVFIFALYVLGMIFISYCTISVENMNRLRFGMDSDGNICGMLNVKADGTTIDLQEYPYLFYLDSNNFRKSKRICIAACPTGSSDDKICSYLGSTNFLDYIHCTKAYPTKPVFNRCIPKSLFSSISSSSEGLFPSRSSDASKSKNAELLATALLVDGRSPLETFSESIADSWWIILLSVGLASMLALLWLYFIPFVSTLVVWITIWFSLIFSIFCTGYVWLQYYESVTDSDFAILNQLEFFRASEDILLGLALIFTLFLIFMLFFMYSCYSRMDLAIQVIDEASNLLKDMQLLFLVPVINYILLGLLFFVSILVISLLIFCKAQVLSTVGKVITSYIMPIELHSDRLINYFIIYYLFGLIWVWNVIDSICDSIIGGAIAEWYWTPSSIKDKHRIPSFALLLRSTKRSIYYSLGSIVMGALLVSFLSAIRYIIEFIKNKLSGVQYRLVRFILSILQFVLFWLEKFVAYLNRGACIHMAMYNSSFLDSVHSIGNLLSRNSFRSVVLSWVSFFVLFMAKASISIVSVLYASKYLFESFMTNDMNFIFKSSQMGILFVILVLSYIVAGAFVSVMDMSIQTLFICFLEDCERNDGTKAKPYLMPVGLHRFIEESKV